MAEIYQLPENGNNGNATIPFSIPIGFGGMNNGGGFGSTPSTDFLKTKLDESDFEVVKDENKAQ